MADADDLTDTTLNVGRTLLDQRAKTFAVELLRKWILDPSNVRLLRVSLDLYPSHDHLSVVLKLLQSYLAARNAHPTERLVCQYVAAEVLRAGATETGFVKDGDELPSGVDLDRFRAALTEFAVEQLDSTNNCPPWYLRQQALLTLAVFHEYRANELTTQGPTYWYAGLHHILSGAWPLTQDGEYEPSTNAIPLILVAHRISGDIRTCASLLAAWIRRSPEEEVLLRIGDYLSEDVDLLKETLDRLPDRKKRFWAERCASIGYLPISTPQHPEPLGSGSDEIRLLDLLHTDTNPFKQETAALRLAAEVTERWTNHDTQRNGLLTPARIGLNCKSWEGLVDPTTSLLPSDFHVTILSGEDNADRRYRIPKWCAERDKWRNEIGQILRAAILGQPDYSRHYRVTPVIEGIRRYRGTSTSWFKRKHGLSNQRPWSG